MGHKLKLARETEVCLLRRLSESDKNAFSELFQRYKGKLYSFLLSITRSAEVSEDIVQDVFLKIWHNRENCRDIDNFNAWVYRLAKNSAIDQLKRISREINVLADINRNSIKFSAEDPLEKLKAMETQKRIEHAISKMPKQQRLVYQLH